MSGRDKRQLPEGISESDLMAFFRLGHLSQYSDREFSVFTGSDIRPLMYMPPNPEAEGDRRLGVYTEFGNVQTITISSHRPLPSAWVLGNASPAGIGRAMRTFAGTMIFNRVDVDALLDGWGRCELERPDINPFFIDAIPPFHIILHAQSETTGATASAAILDIHLGDWGTAFTIEDLVPETTISYKARYIHPFMDRENWRHHLRWGLSKINNEYQLSAGQLAPADANRDLQDDQTEINVEGQLNTVKYANQARAISLK